MGSKCLLTVQVFGYFLFLTDYPYLFVALGFQVVEVRLVLTISRIFVSRTPHLGRRFVGFSIEFDADKVRIFRRQQLQQQETHSIT
eukprot:jgi/Psemu1/309627/fgenesh1_kg.537_\